MNSLIKRLSKKKLKVSFAESCTGGMIASSITSINGASKVFDLGLITYSNQSKIKILKINKNLIKKYGAVSHECCKAMAINLSKISKANINVSITGIAGPKGGSKNKPVGLVYIGVKKDNKVIINKNIFNYRSRISVQKAATKKTLKIILDLIK
ncbi:MAG: CinA family protein [Candidatus Pelagibacter sp. TMED286]|nr:MAG: CinA family protein [Candidatus Pelagibacter sp. TMED286]|tara:strand:- start:1164 stop:1625 length:462 start_codon:yes stop_codon:yes gene_type:complete